MAGFLTALAGSERRLLTDLLFCVCHVTILTNVNLSQDVLRRIGDRMTEIRKEEGNLGTG